MNLCPGKIKESILVTAPGLYVLHGTVCIHEGNSIELIEAVCAGESRADQDSVGWQVQLENHMCLGSRINQEPAVKWLRDGLVMRVLDQEKSLVLCWNGNALFLDDKEAEQKQIEQRTERKP